MHTPTPLTCAHAHTLNTYMHTHQCALRFSLTSSGRIISYIVATSFNIIATQLNKDALIATVKL